MDFAGKTNLVPVLHVLVLLLLLLLVDVPLGRLAFHAGVVGELAFRTLLTQTLLEKGAKNGFGINAWNEKMENGLFKKKSDKLCDKTADLHRPFERRGLG